MPSNNRKTITKTQACRRLGKVVQNLMVVQPISKSSRLTINETNKIGRATDESMDLFENYCKKVSPRQEIIDVDGVPMTLIEENLYQAIANVEDSWSPREADEEEDRVATFKRLEDTWEDIRELL